MAAGRQTPEHVGLLIGVGDTIVRKWLRGGRRHSPNLPDALHQLLGAEAATAIISLIPPNG